MKYFKKALRFATAFTMVCVLVPSAAASDSAMSYKTVYGYSYVYWSTIGNYVSNTIGCGTAINSENGVKVPVGYVGARVRLYDSNGVLKETTDWGYNTMQTTGYTAMESYTYTSGYYYVKGQVKMYNGDGYSTYDSKATPNVMPKQSRMTAQVNSLGDIYGSEIFLNEIGISPNLILAEGENGEVGYVRAEDINRGNVETISEAIAYGEGSTYNVPLYNEDGNTVIGTFTVKKGHYEMVK